MTYLRTFQLIANQSKRELATLMPHLGERGRIAEEIIRGVLDRTLPERFSVGTGVLISASGDTSSQTDIVIFDNFFNSPLLSQFGVKQRDGNAGSTFNRVRCGACSSDDCGIGRRRARVTASRV